MKDKNKLTEKYKTRLEIESDGGRTPKIELEYLIEFIQDLESLPPQIEVSDKEIDRKAKKYYEMYSGLGFQMQGIFIDGARWMRDKPPTPKKECIIHSQVNDYSQDENFWKRLKSFVEDIQTGCCAGEEEKEMLLNVCKKKEQEKHLTDLMNADEKDGLYEDKGTLFEPPLSCVIRDGVGHFCKNCGSSSSRSGFLSLWGKRFCINKKCPNSKGVSKC